MAGLDAKELLHLGLHASQRDEPAKAIDYLKQCLALEPENADATYLLGALYAQIGIYDRARETLARAVDLNGSQTTAIFQLGLLHLSSGDVAQATTVWERLDTLPDDHSFNLFRQGLLALARDDFAQCVAFLERGIEANTFNDALNHDMHRLKASAEAARERNAVNTESPPVTEAVSSGQHLLGSYRQKNRH